MKDRIPTPGKENRVKITQDDGQVIEGVFSYADEAIQEGSFYNKANVLPDEVCDHLGLDRQTAEPKDGFLACFREKKLVERVESSQDWTVPDGIYEIDVYIVGGGASGGYGSSYAGGGGGYCKLIKNLQVTPGTVFPVIIGAGGSGIKGGTTNYQAGKNGGASYFGDYIAEGGNADGSGGSAGGKFSRSYNSVSASGQSLGNSNGAMSGGGTINYCPMNPYNGILYGCGGGGMDGCGGGNGGTSGGGNGQEGGGGGGHDSDNDGTGSAGNGGIGGGGGGCLGYRRSSAYKSGDGGNGLVLIYG